MRIDSKTKSRLLKGIEKVIDRQTAKPKKVTIDIGCFTYKIFENKNHVDLNTLPMFYFPLKWQPLRYIIKPVAHTYYTYTIGNSPMAKEAIKSLRRKQKSK